MCSKTKKLYPRKCDSCGAGMESGYVIGGCENYCSDSCLEKEYSKEDIEDMDMGGDDSDNYWTDWDELEFDVNYTAEGEEVYVEDEDEDDGEEEEEEEDDEEDEYEYLRNKKPNILLTLSVDTSGTEAVIRIDQSIGEVYDKIAEYIYENQIEGEEFMDDSDEYKYIEKLLKKKKVNLSAYAIQGWASRLLIGVEKYDVITLWGDGDYAPQILTSHYVLANDTEVCECESCGHVFEENESFDFCPKCLEAL